LKIFFIFLGKTRQSYLEAAIEDYAARLRRYFPVELIVLKEKYHSNASDEVIKRAGAEQLLSRCGERGFKVALDPTGKQFDSPGLAREMKKIEERGLPEVYFLIGGHLGLDSRVIKSADLVWSLSRLTFTHEMSRVIVLEQLYRACTINGGQKYHK